MGFNLKEIRGRRQVRRNVQTRRRLCPFFPSQLFDIPQNDETKNLEIKIFEHLISLNPPKKKFGEKRKKIWSGKPHLRWYANHFAHRCEARQFDAS
jgi:hypothetical protein